MKLTEILSAKTLSLSFEVFPPKTDLAFDSVENAIFEIAKLRPSFMSVTYGAGGGTSKYTLNIAKDIKSNYNVSLIVIEHRKHQSRVAGRKANGNGRVFIMKINVV